MQALIAGLPTSFDDARQQVVYELASALAAARVVPVGLFRRAQDLLGDAGIVDVTALLQETPGVSLKSNGPGQTEFEMRGMTSSGGNSPGANHRSSLLSSLMTGAADSGAMNMKRTS